MSTPGRNIAASVRARLRNYASTRNEAFDLTLSRYASECFLFRLGASRHRDRLVLKGAGLYAIWGGSMYRPTRDLDFTGYGGGEVDSIRDLVTEICALTSDDGIAFDLTELTVAPIREEAEYGGVRVKMRALLDGAKIPVQLDIGFGDAISPGARDVEYPTMLDGPRPNIRAYPNETVVAEKCHAIATLGELNTRYKDFYDLYALSGQFSFHGIALSNALSATFERRNTAIALVLPVALTAPFYSVQARSDQWTAYLTRNALRGIPSNLSQVGDRVIEFLEPVWRGIASGETLEASWTSDAMTSNSSGWKP